MPYDMGRPPGARSSGGARRRYPSDWEFRDPRFEELSDSQDEDGQGVILDPRAHGRFLSDEPYMHGYDLGMDRISSRNGMFDTYGDEFEYRDREGMAYQAAVRDKEDTLIQTALERIARARAKGKTNVNLSEEEMEALERRRDQQPEPTRPPLASPPPTPAKSASKAKSSSRSNSSSNLATKARKRNSGLFGSSPSPVKSNSKAKVNRSSSTEQALALIPGPNGVPVYAPVPYYGQELVRSQPGSKSASRAGSKQRKRNSTPPDRADSFPQYPPRHYYSSPTGIRPESSGSNRSLPDDADWQPPSRHRSTSNVHYISYPSDYDSAPALPAAQARRNVSGPPDVRYGSVRRVPPSAARPIAQHLSQSDPSIGNRRVSSGLSQEIGESSSSSSSSDEDEEGVEVEILPNGNEYAIHRAPLPAPPVSGNEGRKRRGGGRR